MSRRGQTDGLEQTGRLALFGNLDQEEPVPVGHVRGPQPADLITQRVSIIWHPQIVDLIVVALTMTQFFGRFVAVALTAHTYTQSGRSAANEIDRSCETGDRELRVESKHDADERKDKSIC